MQMPAVRNIFRACLCCLLVFISSSAVGKDASRETGLAQEALKSRTKLMQQNATAADVDAFLAICADNLIYEDPIVKMKVEGKDQIRAGMVGFLGKSRRPVDVIKNQIAVANVVVLEHVLSFESNEHDDVWQPITRRQVTIFEFEGRKIKRMVDYWAR